MYAELEKSVSEEGVDSSATAPFEHLQDSSKGSSSKSRDSSKGGGGPSSMDVDEPQGESADTTLTDDQVTTLAGHTSEVFICAWSPSSLLLASGSGDSTARIWTCPEGPCGKGQSGEIAGAARPPALLHGQGEEQGRDHARLEPRRERSRHRLVRRAGADLELVRQADRHATKHNGPIFSLKWNCDRAVPAEWQRRQDGHHLGRGELATVKQQFAFHKEPTLDVDWRDADSFASCSTDRMIYVCKLGQPSYLKCFQGHRDEVNAIKWDPSASCSPRALTTTPRSCGRCRSDLYSRPDENTQRRSTRSSGAPPVQAAATPAPGPGARERLV